MQPLFFLCVFL
jgi:hypothetical protein